MPREERLQLVFTGALWLSVVGGAATFASCYGHNCDPSSTKYGLNPGEGEAVDADHWESSPPFGNAIPYTRERTISFRAPAFADRWPSTIETFVSAEPNPTAANGNETSGSGNLEEVSDKGPGHFAVRNDTCADYFIRVVVFFAPSGSPTKAVEADPEDAGDASSSD